MSNEREELEEIVALCGGHVKYTTRRILAAGFRKQQQITTAEELDALPEYTVILDSDEVIRERLDDPETNCALWLGRRGYALSYRVPLPATVLHVGSNE